MPNHLSLAPSVVLFLLLTPAGATAQLMEVNAIEPGLESGGDGAGPEWLSQGLFDVVASGQIQTAASIVKIHIGEPGVFHIPLYLMTGTTSSPLGTDSGNEATVWDLISQTGGLLAVAANGSRLLTSSTSGITNLKVGFSASGKLISGQNQMTGDRDFFGGGYLDAGLIFQTGAWEGDGGYEEGGVFWMQARYSYGLASQTTLDELFGPTVAERPHGVRLDGGIYIKDRVNIKVGTFIAGGGDGLPNLGEPQLRFALDYKVSAN